MAVAAINKARRDATDYESTWKCQKCGTRNRAFLVRKGNQCLGNPAWEQCRNCGDDTGQSIRLRMAESILSRWANDGIIGSSLHGELMETATATFASSEATAKVKNPAKAKAKAAKTTAKVATNAKKAPAKTGPAFAITGTLSISRNEMVQKVEQAGGRVTSVVSGMTDYLVLGVKPGNKLAIAQTMGTKVITEKALRKILAK